MTTKIVITVLYFLVLFALGIWASRRVRDMKDYYVAGKGLGYWMVSFSSRATGESGWLLLGLTGFGFAFGMKGFWVVLGEMMGVTLCWVFLTQRFKVLTDHYDSITVTDYLSDRLGDTRHLVRVVATLSLVIFVTAYVAAQFNACGKAFSGFFGLEHTTGVVIGVALVGFYTVAGGFLAVVWSDFIQGILMFLGLVAVPLVALVVVGGPGELISGLAAVQTEGLTSGTDLLSPWGGEFSASALMGAIVLVSIGCGFLGSPQLFVRFISIRDVREIGPGSLVAVLFTLLTDCGAVLTGMCGRVLVQRNDAVDQLREMAGGAEIASAKEQILPYLSEVLFPEMLTGILVAIVLAAIMSTADSLLILVSSAVVRDIWNRTLGVEMTDDQARTRARVVTLVTCLVALGFSLDKESVLFSLVLFAWTGITATFCPPLILSLFWKGLTRAGAVASMCWGLFWTFVWTLQTGEGDAAAHWVTVMLWEGFDGSAEEAMLPAFGGALLVAVLVSLFTSPPEDADEVMAMTREKVVDVWR
ncbi:MAG: sodium/proline symporter [Myxococcota bacterium]|nr:sodium/proline symporter [Myxococcota bacterium]